jgi:anti-sigma regulatory factor (Ser/Thr protein kinase)
MSIELKREDIDLRHPRRVGRSSFSQRYRMFTVIPSATRLVGSLRDLGYDFFHAVADLVDNSISAGAARVCIDLRFDGQDSWVRISDDGHGMSGARLTEALRFGTRRSYDLSDLGKFGLGLKTASLSQARRLSIASRTNAALNRISARMLSLDHIEALDSWEILNLAPSERAERLIEPLRRGLGTVVLWEDLDRILSYRHPAGERARAGFHALADRLDSHLGMVFHRFLSGEAAGRKKITIRINGVEVEPWDPFARGEPATRSLEPRVFEIEGPEGAGVVKFQPFVLPSRQLFTSEDSFHGLSGPARWNRQQGFYIYRGDRMIQSGGWSYVRTADEHTKLARAAIEFTPELDDAFRVNVAKARVLLPPDLREQLEPELAELVREAQAAYRRLGEAPPRIGKRTRRSIRNGARAPLRNQKPEEPRRVLERAARRAGQLPALRAIVKELQRVAPTVAKELGW